MSMQVQQDIVNHLKQKADKSSDTKKAASDKLFSSDLKDKLREFGLEVNSDGKREAGKKREDGANVKETRLKNGMKVSLKFSKEKLSGEASGEAKKSGGKGEKNIAGELVLRDGDKIKERLAFSGEGEKVAGNPVKKGAEKGDSSISSYLGSGQSEKAESGESERKSDEAATKQKSKKLNPESVNKSGNSLQSDKAESENKSSYLGRNISSGAESDKEASEGKVGKISHRNVNIDSGSGFESSDEKEKSIPRVKTEISSTDKKAKEDGKEVTGKNLRSENAAKEVESSDKKEQSIPRVKTETVSTDKEAEDAERLEKGKRTSGGEAAKGSSAKSDGKPVEGEKVQSSSGNSSTRTEATSRQGAEARKTDSGEEVKSKTREILKDEKDGDRRTPLNRDSARFTPARNERGVAAQNRFTAGQNQSEGRVNSGSSTQPVQEIKEQGRGVESVLKAEEGKSDSSGEQTGKKEDLKTPETRSTDRLNQSQNQFNYIRREVGGKIVEVARAQQNSSSQNQDGWQRQRVQLGNGQSMDVAVKNSGGRLSIQLGSMNSELARLLQTNMMDLKAHLEEQLSSEVELEFEMQGDQQSTPEKQDASASSSEGAKGDDTAATGSSGDAVAPRFIGTNQNEWTG